MENSQLARHNLNLYPPRKLNASIALIREYEIWQTVFTGTNIDPQLYQHEARLLAHLHEHLPAATHFSLHTNGRLALREITTFNQYDRAAISLPSFDRIVYHRMMGVPGRLDLPEITRQRTIPIKISCLVASENAAKTPQFLTRCRETGVRRGVLRKPFDETRPWDALLSIGRLDLTVQSARYAQSAAAAHASGKGQEISMMHLVPLFKKKVDAIEQNSNRLLHDFWLKSSLDAMRLYRIIYSNDNFDTKNNRVTLVSPIGGSKTFST